MAKRDPPRSGIPVRSIFSRPVSLAASLALAGVYRSLAHETSEVTFLIIIPVDHSLTRTQPSSCALVTYGASVPNSRACALHGAEHSVDLHERARTPAEWGTRRKSITPNHGVIGSNDQTIVCRAASYMHLRRFTEIGCIRCLLLESDYEIGDGVTRCVD